MIISRNVIIARFFRIIDLFVSISILLLEG